MRCEELQGRSESQEPDIPKKGSEYQPNNHTTKLSDWNLQSVEMQMETAMERETRELVDLRDEGIISRVGFEN